MLKVKSVIVFKLYNRIYQMFHYLFILLNIKQNIKMGKCYLQILKQEINMYVCQQFIKNGTSMGNEIKNVS